MSLGTWLSHHKIITAGIFIFLVILISVTTALAYLKSDNLNSLLDRKGSEALGRTFSIDGDVRIDWSWLTPKVSLEKIRFANADGFSDKNMFEADKLVFRLRIWKLLLGELNVPEIHFIRPKLILEVKGDGRKNWDLPMFSQGEAVTEAALPDDRREFPVIGLLTIQNGTMVYRDSPKKIDLELGLSTATGTGGGGDHELKVSGKGTLQDKVFKLDAHGGSISMLRRSHEDYPLTLNITMGDTKAALKGTFKDPVKLDGVNALFDLQGSNLADIFYLTGIPLPPTPPYKLRGQLVKKASVWSYENFTGKVGDSDLKGDLSYDVSGERGFAKADLVSNFLDIDDLGGFIGLPPSTKKGETIAPEQKAAARKQAASPQLLPDVPINLDRLRAADLNISMKATRVNAPGWPINSLSAIFDLRRGVLKIAPLDMGIASGQVDGSLILDGRKDIPVVTSDLVMKKLKLRDFFSDTRFEALTGGSFGGRIKLKGQGKSLAQVLSNSDGRLTLLMSGGKISLLIIEAAGLDVAQAAPLLLDQDKTTHIRCAIGDFKVTDGILHSETFVFDTNDTNVTGTARINLKDETINAVIKAHPKDTSPLAARTPITISGRMKNPSIGVSPGELAGRGAAAAILGTILTPVAAIIPFIELGLGEDSDCRGLIAQARAKAEN
jgi:uncharacterized protein involved in outer membrane biogenesis